MKLWTLIVDILLWPGRKALALLPNLGEAEGRLIHNMVNYVVWLTLFCGVLIYILIRMMSPV